MYQYIIWYISLCVGGRLVCRSLTVHLSTIRVNNRLDALFYVFISLLYTFRATQCSSSGESIVSIHHLLYITLEISKGTGLPQQAEVAQGVPGRLRPLIFLTFGTTRVVGCQPYAPAAFTPGEFRGTYFSRLIRPQVTWFRR
jgi:hypothetical protein